MTASGSTPESLPGPPQMFTGDVWMESLAVGGGDAGKIHLLKVRFSPGARTAWHSHPVGQILHIFDGVGRIQERGGHVHEIRQGDTTVTEPAVWHWHGAGPTTFMTNLAIQQEDAHGAPAIWGEHVTDEEYAVEPTRD
jgi:quercetin dioxygenase-like cupin family protein